MKIYVTLENNAGVLDSIAVDMHDDDSAEVNATISQMVLDKLDDGDWLLAPGDIIRIIERKE